MALQLFKKDSSIMITKPGKDYQHSLRQRVAWPQD